MISTAPFPWDRGNWECGRSAIHQLDGLTDKQQNQIEDIVRLIPAEERAASSRCWHTSCAVANLLLASCASSRNAHGAHSFSTAGQSAVPKMRPNGSPIDLCLASRRFD